MKIHINDLINEVKIEESTYSLSEVKAAFLALSPGKFSFLEIKDVYAELIRFSWVTENKWLVDHPVESNILHQQRYANAQECVQLIEKIDQEYDIETFEGLVDVPVGKLTFDEVLVFKAATDEIMGKKDNPSEIISTEAELQMTDGKSDKVKEDPLAWLYT